METTLYKELGQIDIDKAINHMVELVLKQYTTDKILLVTIRFTADNYDTNYCLDKLLHIIYYRPNNYTFVGRVENDYLSEDSKIEYLSQHDSCWRQDGTSSVIQDFIRELENEILLKNKENDVSIWTDIYSTEFINGTIIVSGRDAKFKKI